MIRPTLILSLLLLAAQSHALSDSQRLAQLTAASRASPSRLLTLDIPSFEALIEPSTRSYSIFLMLSADPAFCQPCGQLRKQLERISKDYDSLPAKKKASTPLFFAELKISNSDERFLQKYAIRHVPVLYMFRSSSNFPKPLSDNSPDNYPLTKLGGGASQIKDFINARSGAKFPAIRGNYQIPFVSTVRAVMPLILLTVAFSAVLAIITEAYKSHMFWFFLVVLVYIFSVGGGHYSWIHDVPLAVVNKDGIMEYIAPGNRSQYVAEGFFVSATCVSISVLVILIMELPSVMPNKAAQTVAGGGMVFMTMVAISALLLMYYYKMPGYLRYTEM